MKSVDIANNDGTILIFKQRKPSHGFHLLQAKMRMRSQDFFLLLTLLVNDDN